MEDAIGRE